MSKSKFHQVPFESLLYYLHRLGGHHPQHDASFLQAVLNRNKFTSPSRLLILLSDFAGLGGPFKLELISSLNHWSATGIPFLHLFPPKWALSPLPIPFVTSMTAGDGTHFVPGDEKYFHLTRRIHREIHVTKKCTFSFNMCYSGFRSMGTHCTIVFAVIVIPASPLALRLGYSGYSVETETHFFNKASKIHSKVSKLGTDCLEKLRLNSIFWLLNSGYPL